LGRLKGGARQSVIDVSCGVLPQVGQSINTLAASDAARSGFSLDNRRLSHPSLISTAVALLLANSLGEEFA
jgi:hypothetical protein